MYIVSLLSAVIGITLIANGMINHNGSEDYSVFGWLIGGIVILILAAVSSLVEYFL